MCDVCVACVVSGILVCACTCTYTYTHNHLSVSHLKSAELYLRELSLALLRRDKAAVEGSICLGSLVEPSRINGRSQQVVGRRDRVDVTRQVQVEFIHRDHLRVPTTSSATW